MNRFPFSALIFIGIRQNHFLLITGGFTSPYPTDEEPQPFILGQYNTQNMMIIENDRDETGFNLIIEAESKEEIATVSPIIYNANTAEHLKYI